MPDPGLGSTRSKYLWRGDLSGHRLPLLGGSPLTGLSRIEIEEVNFFPHRNPIKDVGR